MNDTHIRRLRDIGSFARPTPTPGERLLCVQYRRTQNGGDQALGAYLLHHLRRLRVIGDEFEMVGLYRSDIEIATLTDKSIASLRRSARRRIQAIRSTDFAEGFISANGGRLARWARQKQTPRTGQRSR